MAGISDKAIKSSYAENKYKYNGIEYDSTFGLDECETYFRNLDPQIGRWWQIDPKPNDMLSPYTAMGNNPVSYGDPLGDTTWVFGNNGKFMGVINDALKNQAHFMSYNTTGEPFDAADLSAEDATKLAKTFRNNSEAFIGENTTDDMKSIEKDATHDGVESAFVGVIGKDKEIRLSKLSMGGNNKEASVENMDQILDKNYSREQQASIFLVGHVHHGKLKTPSSVKFLEFNQWFKGRDARFMALGRPSSPQQNNNGDFGPYLFRNPTDAERGQSAALIVTPYGFTVYGTSTSAQPNPYGGNYLSDGSIQPHLESYFHYKQIKK
jgi:RHS repeat-associated protein